MGALASAGLLGENASDLAAAIAKTLAKSLTMLVSTTMIQPGIAASAPPPAISGSTVGPGSMMASPGPTAALIEGIAQVELASAGLRGERVGDLARVLAQVFVTAIKMFKSQLMIAPGIAIVGGITTAPGMLTGAPPTKGIVEPIALSALSRYKLQGEASRNLAGAIAQVTASALTMLLSSVSVLPGIPSTPAASAGPGRLL